MCGIVGVVAERSAVPILMEGLRRLEYRGYDSAGLAVLDHGQLARLRTVGKVKVLQDALDENPINGSIGIAHTRDFLPEEIGRVVQTVSESANYSHHARFAALFQASLIFVAAALTPALLGPGPRLPRAYTL